MKKLVIGPVREMPVLFPKPQGGPTQRAADKWESPRFRSIFLASSFFLLSSRIQSRPLAANASR